MQRACMHAIFWSKTTRIGVVAAGMACHDGLHSLTVCLHTLLAPVQFIATKLQAGKEAQTGPADIWRPL